MAARNAAGHRAIRLKPRETRELGVYTRSVATNPCPGLCASKIELHSSAAKKIKKPLFSEKGMSEFCPRVTKISFSKA